MRVVKTTTTTTNSGPRITRKRTNRLGPIHDSRRFREIRGLLFFEGCMTREQS